MYSVIPQDKKYTFLVNFNKANNFKQADFFLPLPITSFRYVTLVSTQFFAVSTNFTSIGYYTDFYDPNSASRLVPGLIVANEIIKSPITSNQIVSLSLQLVIPSAPIDTDVFQGALVFSNT
jgi:hypothetical protein